MKKTDMINQLMLDNDLTITPLRRDVLDIFLSSKKPLSAYNVLEKLKKTSERITTHRLSGH